MSPEYVSSIPSSGTPHSYTSKAGDTQKHPTKLPNNTQKQFTVARSKSEAQLPKKKTLLLRSPPESSPTPHPVPEKEEEEEEKSFLVRNGISRVRQLFRRAKPGKALQSGCVSMRECAIMSCADLGRTRSDEERGRGDDSDEV